MDDGGPMAGLHGEHQVGCGHEGFGEASRCEPRHVNAVGREQSCHRRLDGVADDGIRAGAGDLDPTVAR